MAYANGTQQSEPQPAPTSEPQPSPLTRGGGTSTIWRQGGTK